MAFHTSVHTTSGTLIAKKCTYFIVILLNFFIQFSLLHPTQLIRYIHSIVILFVLCSGNSTIRFVSNGGYQHNLLVSIGRLLCGYAQKGILGYQPNGLVQLAPPMPPLTMPASVPTPSPLAASAPPPPAPPPVPLEAYYKKLDASTVTCVKLFPLVCS